MLNRLVWSCFSRKTQFKEGQLEITFQPLDNERVLFFVTDCPDGRQSLALPPSDPICDIAVFYRGAQRCPVLLLAELKSCDYSHAIKQLCVTLSAIEAHMPPASVFPSPKWVFLIVSAASAPPNQRKLEREIGRTDVKLAIRSGRRNRPVDIREFLTS